MYSSGEQQYGLPVIVGKVSTGIAQGIAELPERVPGGLIGNLSVDPS
jgi:hypothetical protein